MLVSVIIVNYNYGRFLRDAIESALNQTYPEVEVIVVDDGSTDNSREIITEYADTGKVIPVFKENGGQASAFNAGFAVASGDVICFLDSDDVFLPNKIDRVVNLLSLYREADWLCHALCWQFPDGTTRVPFPYRSPIELRDYREDFTRGKLKAHFQATSALCFKRKLLHNILPVPEEIYITADNYIKFAAAGLGPVLLVNEPLAVQRIHGGNSYTLRSDIARTSVSIHISIAKNLRSRVANAGNFSYRLAAHHVGRALSELGFSHAVRYAREASRSLGFYPIFYGTLKILVRAILVAVRRKLLSM